MNSLSSPSSHRFANWLAALAVLAGAASLVAVGLREGRPNSEMGVPPPSELLELTSGNPALWRFDGQYKCGPTKIEADAAAVARNHGLTMFPQDFVLPRTSAYKAQPSGPPFVDAEFSSDCGRVYYIDDLGNLNFFDLKTRTTESLPIPLTALPPGLRSTIVGGGTDYQPTIDFMYPIDDHRLLLSISDNNTGGDVYSNLYSQAIFDFQEGILTFVSGGDKVTVAEPVLFDRKSETLFYPSSDVTTASPQLDERVEIDLKTGITVRIGLRAPFVFSPPCDPEGPAFATAFETCRINRLQPLFDLAE